MANNKIKKIVCKCKKLDEMLKQNEEEIFLPMGSQCNTGAVLGVNEKNYYILSYSDDDEVEIKINYCPFCGRKLVVQKTPQYNYITFHFTDGSEEKLTKGDYVTMRQTAQQIAERRNTKIIGYTMSRKEE